VAQAVKTMASQSSGPGAGGGEGFNRPAWLDRPVAWAQDLHKFLHEVRGEMGHVTWPSFPEVRSTTFIVIVTIFFFGAFFFVVDGAFGRLIQMILTKYGKS
jgi:preprotein translocase SecE subunit